MLLVHTYVHISTYTYVCCKQQTHLRISHATYSTFIFSSGFFFFHLKPNKTQTINLESPVYIPKNYPVKDDNEVLLLQRKKPISKIMSQKMAFPEDFLLYFYKGKRIQIGEAFEQIKWQEGSTLGTVFFSCLERKVLF